MCCIYTCPVDIFDGSVQFKMVSMRSKMPTGAPHRLRSFPNVAFKMLPMLSDDGPLSSFQKRSSSASSFHASLLQAINGVMSLALCPPVMSQATQHFRSSEKQATCVGCFSSQFICSVISLHSSMLTGVLEGGRRLSTHSSLGFPFHFPLFLASSLNHNLFDGIIDTI